MTLARWQAGLFGIAVAALACGFIYQHRKTRQLRAEISRRTTDETAQIAALEKSAAAENQRAIAAEARVTMLLEKARAAKNISATTSATNADSISAEDAVKAVVARAERAFKDGRPAEAVDDYVKCYRELHLLHPGSGECQRIMSALARLGRTYPAARDALGGLRDASMAQMQAEPSRRELPFEIALLNERLGEGHRTLALYDQLPPDDINRGSLAMIAFDAFVEARRYTDALLGKPFGRMLNTVEAATQQLAAQDATRQEMIRKAVVASTIVNIEVLTGASRPDDARTLTEKLLALDNSESTRASLQRHVERAQAPPP